MVDSMRCVTRSAVIIIDEVDYAAMTHPATEDDDDDDED